MSYRVTFSDRCTDAFIEPYKQGAYNLRDAFTGTKTEMIGLDAISGAHIINVRDLSLGERVSAFAIGSLLIVPIVNMVVLAILRNVENNFLYGYNKNLSTFQYPVFLPQNPPPAGNNPAQPNAPEHNPPQGGFNPAQPNGRENAAPAGNNPAQPNAPEHNPPQGGFNPNLLHINPPQGFVGGFGAPNINQPQGQPNLNPAQDPVNADQHDPHLVRHVADIVANILVDENLQAPAEFMVARKNAALNRLDQIEAMIPANVDDNQQMRALVNRFQCHHNVMEFNIDEVLAGYQTNRTSDGLFDFLDWANISAEKQAQFREAINDYDENHHNPHYRTVNGLFKNLLAYFTQRKDDIDLRRAALDSADDDAVNALDTDEGKLRDQFDRACASIIDANANCIDQMLSQLQTLALDIIVEGTFAAELSLQQKLLNQARLSLCKYRLHLFKQILIEQNPHEAHMADLERAAVQQFAQEFGLRGDIFEGGAQYAFLASQAAINRAIATFRQQYKPEEYFLTGLRSTIEGHDLSNAFANLTQWACQYYDLDSENLFTLEGEYNRDEPRLPHYMDHRISDDPEAEPVSTRLGAFTIPATALMLETLGVIRARA